ncbi:MAG: DNA polymerase III subunit [Chloroflexi bacterium]|jgi:DNA polymerase-3 subunit delta'|nr:DNA polymerase III subunit [Chloroflexota bacterium]
MSWNLMGHEWAVNLLGEHIRSGGVRHAYLFTGPAGVGKRTLALSFARALSCQNKPSPGDYCGQCRPCQMIARQQFSDLAVLQAETVGGEMKVDTIRELQHALSLTPYETDRRIAVLLRFHEANENAQNALLKTLEEAPGKSILLLTADTPENLLPTIVSRCELLRLRPLSVDALGGQLQKNLDIHLTRALALARISSGRPGIALRLHSDPDLEANRKQWMDHLLSLLGESMAQRFDYVEKQVKLKNSSKEERDQLRMRLREGFIFWQSLWRDVLLQSSGMGEEIANVDYRPQIEKLAAAVNAAEAGEQITRLEVVSNRLGNANIQLLIESLVMSLPAVSI